MHCFSSYSLKRIALFTMLIDHIGILFFPFMSHELYDVLRCIGRISFPVFCFLLVEGFFHTHDPKGYMIRLGIFGLVSEIPFDIGLHLSLLDNNPGIFVWSAQNVFLTLFLGFAAMWFISIAGNNTYKVILYVILFPVIAELAHTDYGALGVYCILFFYFRKCYVKQLHPEESDYHRKQTLSLFIGLLPLMGFVSKTNWICAFALLAFVPLSLYNGKRGNGLRYFFYLFYPAHILILYTIRELIFIMPQ